MFFLTQRTIKALFARLIQKFQKTIKKIYLDNTKIIVYYKNWDPRVNDPWQVWAAPTDIVVDNMKKFKLNFFWQQLVASNLMINIILIIVAFVLFSTIYRNSIIDMAIRHSESELQVMENNFNNFLSQYKNIADNIYYNKNFTDEALDMLEGKQTSLLKYSQNMNSVLDTIYFSNNIIDTVVYIDNFGNTFSAGIPYFDETAKVSNQFSQKIEKEKGRLVWGYADTKSGGKIVICRNLFIYNDSGKMVDAGKIIIFISEAKIYDFYKDFQSLEDSRFYLLNESTVISSSLRNNSGKNLYTLCK